MTNFVNKIVIFVFFFVIFGVGFVYCSEGDRSTYYQRCVRNCIEANCSQDGRYFKPLQERSLFIHYLWTCNDDCQYNCMWKTVDAFVMRSWDIPQFHGKWPFVRFMGLQEPASVLFSVFNFMTHYIMLRQFRNEVQKRSPLYKLWHMFGFVCLNGWFWSAVFHARDTSFTEKMDYFCAFSMILFSCYAMFMRFLHRRYAFFTIILTIFSLLLFVHHISYLSMVVFDYGYNMRANVFIGALCIFSTLVWCAIVRRKQPYVWRCAVYFILTGMSSFLEVTDFPPWFWVIDAHSLFHLSTAFLPLLFYRFLIDDCKYLLKKTEEKNILRKNL